MSERKPHIGFRILRFAAWMLLALVILAAGLRLGMKTDWMNRLVKDQIVSVVNKNLNGTLSIGSMKGDLWKELIITDILLVQNDTLATVDSLKMNYEILSVLDGVFNMNKIGVSGVYARIAEEEEQFNIQRLLKEDSDSTSVFGFSVQDFTLQKATIDVFSPSYLPDTSLSVSDLNARASLRYTDEITASLSGLSFNLNEGRLPEPVRIKTSASYGNRLVTLQELVVETGRSYVESSGSLNLRDSTLNASAVTKPLSLADIRSYLAAEIPADELRLTLSLKGGVEHVVLETSVYGGQGFEHLRMLANLNIADEPALNYLELGIRRADMNYFTSDSLDIEAGSVSLKVEGAITSDLENSVASWEFTGRDIYYREKYVREAKSKGKLRGGNITDAEFNIFLPGQQLALQGSAESLLSDQPAWRVRGQLLNADISYLADDPSLQSSINLGFSANGTGFNLNKEQWEYSISTGGKPGSEIAGQAFSIPGIEGSISEEQITASGALQFIQSRINVEAEVRDFLSGAPEYSYQFSVNRFDLSEIRQLSDFPTSLNLSASGEGKYFSLEKMQVSSSVKMDTSVVNGASIRKFESELSLVNGILRIPDGQLESDIIDGSFSARINVLDETDPDDELEIDFLVKNTQPLAPLVGAERFGAEGKIQGMIVENRKGQLEFDGNVDLHGIFYDDLFKADTIAGHTIVGIGEDYNFNLNVQIGEPEVSGIVFQDVEFKSEGTMDADTLFGGFDLTVKSSGAGQIRQAGQFGVSFENLKTELRWDLFNFRTPVRLLSLQRPFHLVYENKSIRTDTLHLEASEGSYLSLSVPYADSLNQEVWVNGQNFDFGVIQEILFDERYVDGILLGEVEAVREGEFLEAHGAFQIQDLNYKGTQVERFELIFDIVDERLAAEGNFRIDGEKKITGSLNVPFVLQDPSELQDSFFEEPVSGQLTVKPMELNRFESILNNFQVTRTEGILSFDASLSGQVGRPDLNGMISLGQPTLSGIAIDSAFAHFGYDHNNARVLGSAEIQAKGQRAAYVELDFPVSVDFRTLEIKTPGEDDIIRADVKTENFNISVFNDFLNKDYLTRLRGVLNAELHIEGPKSKLVPEGYLRLENSEVRVPVGGIKLADIKADFQFNEKGLNLRQFSAKSGKGDFRANGQITLQGIQPVDLNITARARQFKLANTEDYNFTVDLDGKLTGKPTRPLASGKLTIRNGFLFLQDFGEKSVESVTLEDEEESTFSPYDSLAIDMHFVIENDFYVRNRRYLDMEVEMTGDLDAQKQTGGDLEIFGNLTGESGYARPLGKQFKLDEAEFIFSGPVENPNIYIKTSYLPPSPQKEGQPIVLYYIIEGTAQNPEFRFESDPPMEQQDIIAYTLFGRPFYALESWQQVISGGGNTSATNLLVDVLLDEVEALATRELGIDVVQIDNTRSGSESGTSIKTGWYLNRKTFFAVVNEISGATPKTLFILEYMLTKNLDLILTQGDDNRQGIDLRWQYDY